LGRSLDGFAVYGARLFGQGFTLKKAIEFHAFAPLACTRVSNGIPLGCPLFLPVHTVNCVQTLKGSLWTSVRVSLRC
jgi:hypothetical protein